MLLGDMDIFTLMVYVQKVQKENVKDIEEYRNKKAKTENEYGKQNGASSRPQFQKPNEHAPSSA